MKKYLPYIIFALSTLILLIRAFYSFCWSDETFYFSTCHRFFTGDSVFLNEWFPTQLSSLILLPFYSIYMFICGSNTGIILYFRILYVIFSLVNALVIYKILKQHISDFLSLTCSLLVLFYTHLNIATLSYYTLSVQLFLMTMILIYHYYKTYNRNLLIVAGFLFALSVLALPTLCIGYFIALFIVLILLLSVRFIKLPQDFKNFVHSADLPAIIGYTFIGICIPAALFFLFLFGNVSIRDFINGIPYVLTDEEHTTSLIYPIRKFFISINEVYKIAGYVSYLIIVCSFVLSVFKKNNDRKITACIFIADTLTFIFLFVFSVGHTGYIQTALCLYFIPLFFMMRKKDLKAFILFIISGMVMSLTYSYSSNGYLYVLSMGHFIAAIGCIIIADGFINEADFKKPAYTITITAAVCAALVQTMELRLVNIYRDAPAQMLNFRITDGPAKGLMTTSDHYVSYNIVYSTIKKYCMSSELNSPQRFDNSMELNSESVGNIFITKLLPWGYMCTDLRVGAPTTWRTSFDSVRLEPYYGLNPGRYPDMILCLNDEYGSYLTCGDVEGDPSPNENTYDGFLLDYIQENDYETISVPCGTLYKRK